MKRIVSLLLAALFSVSCVYAAEQHRLFTEVLRAHVKDGRVDYSGLCNDARFMRYMEQLMAVDPGALASEDEKKAFWINAYNAWTLKIICDNYPLKSISELHTGPTAVAVVFKTTVWNKELVTVNGKPTSLDFIEHKILRPVFKDPRIHFAIVCAAKGCPPLRSEAYEAEKLDAQLEEQGRVFLSQEKKNRLDISDKIAYLSPVFNWFKDDFGSRREEVLLFISKFLSGEAAQALRSAPAQWRIRYTYYDWSLNE